MILYSLHSGTKFPQMRLSARPCCILWHTLFLIPRRPRKQPLLRFPQMPKEARSSYNLDGALDNGFIYHWRVPNGHLLELLVEFSLCMPNLTASRTLSTVILGWYAGLVPCWKTPVRTRIEYHVFCALPDSSNSLVPRMSDSGVSPTKYTLSGGWLIP
jgi:hypothetical protein